MLFIVNTKSHLILIILINHLASNKIHTKFIQVYDRSIKYITVKYIKTIFKHVFISVVRSENMYYNNKFITFSVSINFRFILNILPF